VTEHTPFIRHEPELSTRPVTQAELEQLGAAGLQAEDGPLFRNQWVFMTAQRTGMKPGEIRAANERLAADIRKLGYEPIPVRGRYGEPEESFWTLGLPNTKAVELGAKYGQESIATPIGLLYTDGTRQSIPITGEVTFNDHTATDFYTDIPLSRQPWEWDEDVQRSLAAGERLRVQVEYDGDPTPFPDELAELDQSLLPSGRQRVAHTFRLDDRVMPGQVQAYWDALQRVQAERVDIRPTFYLHGDIARPNGTEPIYEHLYSDGIQTAVVRSRDGDSLTPNTAVGFIPASDALRYETGRNRLLHDDRVPHAEPASGLMGDALYDNELRVALDQHGPDVKIDQKNALRVTIDGKRAKYFALYVGNGNDLPALSHSVESMELAARDLVGRFQIDPTLVVFGEMKGRQVVDLELPPHPDSGKPDIEVGFRALRTLRRAGAPIKDTGLLRAVIEKQEAV
jgi:hypothetical protein